MVKKIFFIILCIFLNNIVTKAIELESVELPYYAKIHKYSDGSDRIIQIKKVYIKDTSEIVFNIDFNKYDTQSDFIKYDTYDKNIWQKNKQFIGEFETIVHNGYMADPTDINYYTTQMIIWDNYVDINVTACDAEGNFLSNYDTLFSNTRWRVTNHYLLSDFFNKTYTRNLWETDKFTYALFSVILDNPKTDAFQFDNDGNDLYITTKKPGIYELHFTKQYDHEVYCYSDGNNVYWQNIKGPMNIDRKLTYIVEAVKLKVVDLVNGYDGRYGDTLLNKSNYELYLNDDLVASFESGEEIYVNKNSNYVLKDISNNDAILNIEDMIISIENDDKTIYIEKNIVTKNISVLVNDEYLVYLKSNNELYASINKDTDVLTLPYGIYYIKSLNNNYYSEYEVKDSIDGTLIIENVPDNIELDNDESSNQDDIDTNTNIEELEINDNENINESVIENYIENPNTYDSLFSDILVICVLSIILIITFRLLSRL